MAEKTTAEVKVRMPKGLHRRIQREADRHGQTINAEILVRLEGSFEMLEFNKRLEHSFEIIESNKKILERISAVTREMQEAMGTMTRPSDFVSDWLSKRVGLPADVVVRVIEDEAKKHKPGGSTNE
jgi:Arc-like DNA binding domain